MRLPDLAFSDYFLDHNHRHNIDEEDVLDAIYGRRILITREYFEDGKRRRRIYAKNDEAYLRIIVEPTDEGFWWILSAYPANRSEMKRMRQCRVGDEE